MIDGLDLCFLDGDSTSFELSNGFQEHARRSCLLRPARAAIMHQNFWIKLDKPYVMQIARRAKCTDWLIGLIESYIRETFESLESLESKRFASKRSIS